MNEDDMQEINLRLAVEEVNVILEGVGNLPFARVYTLVGKIQQQAAQQMRAGNGDRPDEASGAALAAETAR
jgi:hypothetical protein